MAYCLHATLKGSLSFSLFSLSLSLSCFPSKQAQRMQITTALALSPSAPFLKPKYLLNRNPNPRIVPVQQLNLFTSTNGLSCQRSSSLFSARTSVLFPYPNPRFSGFKFRASSVPANDEENQKSSSSGEILQLGIMFAIWYLLNIYFNIFNKQVHSLCRYWFWEILQESLIFRLCAEKLKAMQVNLTF